MTKKKIALVTCYFQHNFGSQLQAYATQMYFDKLNIPNETICIDGIKKEINKAKIKYFLSRCWDINTIKDKFSTVKKIWALKTGGEALKKNLDLRKEMFNQFSKNMFRISQRCNSINELTDIATNYSAFIVGSDQLWLPSNIEANYYTLNFVPKDIPKISLATSFGISKLPKKQAKKAASFLKRLDFCSVRETSGKEIIKKLINKDVPVVCDPTILFTATEWNSITKPERFYKEPYLFCYFLGNNPQQRKFVKRFKEKTGYKIIQLQHCDEYIKSDVDFPDYAPYNVGPSEFIQLIRDAEYVFTDSFHCSVFSMLYAKNFFTFRRYHSDNIVSTNGRLYSLLSIASLKDRLLTGSESVEDCLIKEINYNNVHEKLRKFRDFTKEYIENALNQIGIKYDTNR